MSDDKPEEAAPLDTHSSFPPIERWWPVLSIEAKHLLLEDLEAEVSELVVQEIESEVTSRIARDNRYLTEAERAYIRTQIEIVD